MQNCEFKMKTKLIFGRGTECNVGEEMKKLGKKALFLHYGASGPHIYETGLYDRIVKSLKDAGMEFVEMDGVVPNPRVSLMRKGVELCKAEGVDCILGVGGGSVFDSCKGIGIGVCNDLDILDYCGFKNEAKGCLPLGCIVTIPAAGSEVSNNAMIVNDDGGKHVKVSMFSEYIRPQFAILNPELTFSLPPVQTAAGATDIIAHTMERYFGNSPEGANLLDRYAESTMIATMQAVQTALVDPTNYAARGDLMMCADLCHGTLLDIGRLADWGIHGVENVVTTTKDIPHGVGLASVMPAFMRYVYKKDMLRFTQFAVRVMGAPMDFENPEKTVLEGIRRFEAFLKSIGMPTKISEVGIKEEDIPGLVAIATSNGNAKAGMVFQLDAADCEKIYRDAL